MFMKVVVKQTVIIMITPLLCGPSGKRYVWAEALGEREVPSDLWERCEASPRLEVERLMSLEHEAFPAWHHGNPNDQRQQEQ